MSSDFMGSDTEPEVKSEGGSDKENVEEAKQGPPDSKKGKKRVIERGRHSTPEKRAKQFPVGQFPRALNRGKLFREQKNILFLKKKFYH